jgi:hypothetical protein
VLKAIETTALIAALIFAACLFVLTFLYASPIASTDSPQQQHAEKNEPEKNNSETYKSFWERARTDPVSFFTLWLVVFTAVLSGVGVVQLKLLMRAETVAEKSANAAKESADSLVITERPYIFMTTPVIVRGPNDSYGLSYAFTNYGRTPAILRFYTGQTYIKDESQRPIDTAIWNGWEVLRPGESHQGKFFEIRQQLNVEKHPLFWVEVFYLDMFNYTHTSGFTFFYMEDIRHKGEFVAIASEKYNYHRTEKLDNGEWHPRVGKPPTD